MDEITDDKKVSLGINALSSVLYKFRVREFSNFPAQQDIYLHDKVANIYHDMKSGEYFFNVAQDGHDANRFEIVFELPNTLGVDSQELNDVSLYYDRNSNTLSATGLDTSLTGMALYDLSGKMVVRFRESELNNIQSGVQLPVVQTGIYLVQLETENQTTAIKLAIQ